jgi:cytoskeletal protein CcmA (bactofilin family)
MSTFTNWNGPGDIPGDLTIFYQRLKELSDKIDATVNVYATKTDFDELEAKVDAIPDYTPLAEAVHALQVDVSNLSTNEGSLASQIATLNASLSLLQGAFELKGAAQVWALRTWIFTASSLWTNRINSFDDHLFRKINDTDVPTGVTPAFTDAKCLTVGNDYVLAVTDTTEFNNDAVLGYGGATAYFITRDTMNISAVVHFAVHFENTVPTSNAHGALAATYCYTGHGSSTSGSRCTFSIKYGTTTNGKKVYFLTITPPQNTSQGYVWVVGRGWRRYLSNDGAPGAAICTVTTEDGTAADGACHGNIMTGLRVNDFSSSGDVHAQGDLYVSGDTAVGGELEVSGKAAVVGDLTVGGSIQATSVNVDTGNLNINNLVVSGTSQLSGAVKMSNTLNVSGNITGGNNASITSTLSAGAGKFSGSAGTTNAIEATKGNVQVTDGNINVSKGNLALGNGTLNVSGASTLSGNVTVGGTQLTASNAAVSVKSVTSPTGGFTNLSVSNNITAPGIANLITDNGSRIQVGSTSRQMSLLGNNNRLTFQQGTGTGATKQVAYLDDILAGMEFQRAVTVYRNVVGAPPSTFTSVVLDTGMTLTFTSGDTCLARGTISSPPAVYTYSGTAWSKTTQYTVPPKAQDYMEWEWFGLAPNSVGQYARSYVIWNPNNEGKTDPDWSVLDIHMDIDEYRTASEQDEVDRTLADLASYQPDWLANDPMIDVPSPVPPDVPNRIPNPAYIQNKPLFGMTSLIGGDWDSLQTMAYDVIVDGGDYTDIPPPTPVVDQTPKNVVMKLMHGTSANIPVADASTAFSLKYCTDTKKLYIDTGTANVLLATGA